jgi:hypothetical protein
MERLILEAYGNFLLILSLKVGIFVCIFDFKFMIENRKSRIFLYLFTH